MASGVLAVAVLAIAGCAVTSAPAPGPASSSSFAAPAPADSATPPTTAASTPVLVPDGTAADNMPLFRAVVERVWGGSDRVHGRAYIDALVKAGFDKKSMQVTEDRSTVGNPAESLQFAVRWKDGQCLIGQVGPETGSPVTALLPGLAGGACLVGTTRTIDW